MVHLSVSGLRKDTMGVEGEMWCEGVSQFEGSCGSWGAVMGRSHRSEDPVCLSICEPVEYALRGGGGGVLEQTPAVSGPVQTDHLWPQPWSPCRHHTTQHSWKTAWVSQTDLCDFGAQGRRRVGPLLGVGDEDIHFLQVTCYFQVDTHRVYFTVFMLLDTLVLPEMRVCLLQVPGVTTSLQSKPSSRPNVPQGSLFVHTR